MRGGSGKKSHTEGMTANLTHGDAIPREEFNAGMLYCRLRAGGCFMAWALTRNVINAIAEEIMYSFRAT